MADVVNGVGTVLKKYEQDLLKEWVRDLTQGSATHDRRMGEQEIREQAQEFLNLLQVAAQQGHLDEIDGPSWRPVKEFLEGISTSRARQGFSASETATFIFSFKKPFFARLREELGADSRQLLETMWSATELLDKLGLFTAETFQKAREAIIARMQEEMLELSTPVVKLWDGILALPMIGTLDSSRTQIVMESLLERIVETGSEIAIIDITGVPTVDTLVAQHLLKTVTAIRLMGAECIISGIRPQIAQTIVHLGVELHGVTTKANLSDALSLALRRCGLAVTKLSK